MERGVRLTKAGRTQASMKAQERMTVRTEEVGRSRDARTKMSVLDFSRKTSVVTIMRVVSTEWCPILTICSVLQLPPCPYHSSLSSPEVCPGALTGCPNSGWYIASKSPISKAMGSHTLVLSACWKILIFLDAGAPLGLVMVFTCYFLAAKLDFISRSIRIFYHN